jgi:PAP2 superfamily
MSMAPSSAPSTVEAEPLSVLAGPRLRAELAALARDLRGGWTGRCLALTLGYVAFGYAVSWWGGLPVHWPLVYMGRQAELVTLIVYLPLVVAYFAKSLRASRDHTSSIGTHLLSPRFAGEFVFAMLAVHVTLMMFVNLKQYVPALNETLWDSPLWWLDDRLHLGISPAPAVHELAAAWGLLPVLDRIYLLYFPAQVVVPLLFLIAARLRPQRGRFFFAYCLIWMVGSVLYIAWPSLGPCYYRPSRFLWLDLAPYAQYVQEVLIKDYAIFRTDPSYYEVKLYRGVAALPSLHVGVLALFAIATRRWRALSLVLWTLTALTFVGSMALAWHYAVDGYLGVAIAWGCWWAAGRLCGATAETAPPGSRA